MSNGISYHNQLLTILVTEWSPFGHQAVGHRFSYTSFSADRLLPNELRESKLPVQ